MGAEIWSLDRVQRTYFTQMYVPEINQKMFCFTNNYSTRRFKDKGKMSTIQKMLINATHVVPL